MKSNLHRFTVSLALAAVCFMLAPGCSKEAKLKQHLDRASKFFDAQDYAKSEIEYRNALRLSPSNTFALARVGLIFFEVGQIPQAFVMLSRVAQIDPTNLLVRMRLGQVSVAGRMLGKARSEALYILGKDPRYPEAPLLLADSSMTPEESEDSISRLKGLMKTAGEMPDYHLALGGLALRKGETNTAEAEFSRALAMDPKSPVAHLAMGNLSVVKGDFKQAEAYFKKGHDLSPVRSPLRLRYADFKLNTGNPTEAREILGQILKEVPDHLPALSFLSSIAYVEGKFDECTALTQRIVLRDPTNLDALLMNAKISFRKGEREKTLKESAQLSALYPRSPVVKHQAALAHLINNDQDKAIAALVEATASDPNFGEAVVLLADLRIRKGDYAPAIVSLTQLLRNRPDYLLAQFSLASAYMARRTPDDAVAIYKYIMKASPKNALAPVLLGGIYRQQKKPAEARQAFDTALTVATNQPQYYLTALESLVELDLEQKRPGDALKRLQPFAQQTTNSPAARYMLAKAHIAMTNVAQAETELKAAIEQEPNFRQAYILLSGIYSATKRGDEALKNIETLIQKRTNDWAAYMLIATIQSQAGRSDKAVEAYEKVVSLNPKHVVALNNLATVYAEQEGKLDKALDYATRAREISRNDPFTADTLGWVHFKRRDYGLALSLIQESLRGLPLDPEIHYHLGMTHYMLGEEGSARVALEKAAQGQKPYTGKEEAKRRLAILSLDPKAGNPKAIEELEKVLDDQPGDPIAFSRLGSALEATGKLDRAVKIYEQALKANPKLTVAATRLASLYADRLDKLPRAIEVARASREASPQDAAAGLVFARIALRSERGDDQRWALGLFQDASARMLNQAEVFFDLAVAQFLTGQTAPAALSMRNALTVAGTSGFARAEDARKFLSCLDAIRDPKLAAQAAAMVQELLNRQPEHVPALIVAATIYEQKGQHSVAAQALEKAMKRAPLCAVAAGRMAILNAEYLGNDAKALELGMKVKAALPDDLDLAASLGRASYRKNEFSQAVRLLKEVSAKRAKEADAFYYLGLSHAKLNEKREAKEALQKAVQMDAKHKLAGDAKKVLSELSKS